MRRARLWGLVLLVSAAAACSQFKVRSRQDPAADFGRLRTYAWLPPGEAAPADQRVNDPAIDTRIRAATEQELRAKGYRPADGGPPDLLLNYRLSTSPGDALRSGRRGYVEELWWGFPGAASVYDSYDEGTLYIAALTQAKKMIWVGAASARLLPHISYQKRAKRVDSAVHQILGPFPKRET